MTIRVRIFAIDQTMKCAVAILPILMAKSACQFQPTAYYFKDVSRFVQEYCEDVNPNLWSLALNLFRKNLSDD